jgi:hypothetical protein
MADDLSVQFNQRVVRKLRAVVNKRMQEKMIKAADQIVNSPIMQSVYNNSFKDFHNVTGNMYKSTWAGVYYTGTDSKAKRTGLVYAVGTPGEDPTMETLRAHQAYPLDEYYRGDSVFVDSKGRKWPYVGEYGEGGQDGEFAGYQNVTEGVRIPKRNTWTLTVGVGVQYAGYVFKKEGHDYLTALRDYIKRYHSSITRL